MRLSSVYSSQSIFTGRHDKYRKIKYAPEQMASLLKVRTILFLKILNEADIPVIPAFKRLKHRDHNLKPTWRLCSRFEAILNGDKGLNTFSSSKLDPVVNRGLTGHFRVNG